MNISTTGRLVAEGGPRSPFPRPGGLKLPTPPQGAPKALGDPRPTLTQPGEKNKKPK